MSDATTDHPEALWTSENPKYGVVRQVLHQDGFAVRFDDLNGDHREICLTVFQRGASGWQPIAQADDVEYPAHLEDSACWGYAGRLAWAVGRGRPGDQAVVHIGAAHHPVHADDDGWWLVLQETDPLNEGDDWPEVSVRR
ncbi:hypothetical protein NODU109028_05590 [Nocardioides dubius]|uniref:Uncharacterized protein n=1 Tax=Nocardioides dubius TaxID=317019 RepID=A0ABN1TPX1_9ACTN